MKKTIKENLPFIIVIILLLSAGFLYYIFMPKPDIGPNEAVLTIDFGDSKRSFVGETIEGMTVYHALLASKEAGKLDVDFDSKEIKRINRIEQNGKKWRLYLNQEMVEEYFDQVLVNPGDRVELKFE